MGIIKHGIYVSEKTTSVSTPVVAESGVPFVIGAAPVQSANEPAEIGQPVLLTSWDEFENAFGNSDDWDKYNLCEFAYSHFKLYGCQPVIFCNLLNPSSMKSAVTAEDMEVSNKQVKLPLEAIDSTALVVKAAGGAGDAYTKDTDYTVFYANGKCIVELISTSTHAAETRLNIAYDAVTPASVNATLVASSLDTIELCMSSVGIVPDLIYAPGFSKVNSVAAVMATKAASINGVFQAKAVIDIDSSVSGVTSYSGIAAYKATNNLTDPNMILCWPLVKLGDKVYHMSTALAGLMASVDTDNDGVPFESPSNKNFKMDALVLASGAVIKQTKAQADTINGAGVITALNFLASGWVCWGNYTACYPSNTDVKDYFVPVSRMFDWVGNTLVKTFWSKLDQPMNRRLIDTILDSSNIWLNGLVGRGYLLGARAVMLANENPLTDLMSGIIRLHIYMTPASPAQEIDFALEYDVNYVTSALS